MRYKHFAVRKNMKALKIVLLVGLIGGLSSCGKRGNNSSNPYNNYYSSGYTNNNGQFSPYPSGYNGQYYNQAINNPYYQQYSSYYYDYCGMMGWYNGGYFLYPDPFYYQSTSPIPLSYNNILTHQGFSPNMSWRYGCAFNNRDYAYWGASSLAFSIYRLFTLSI